MFRPGLLLSGSLFPLYSPSGGAGLTTAVIQGTNVSVGAAEIGQFVTVSEHAGHVSFLDNPARDIQTSQAAAPVEHKRHAGNIGGIKV